MFANISYKKKLGVLAILIVTLFMVANKRSFRATMGAYHQMKEVQSKLDYMRSSSYNSKQLQSQIALYDNLIGSQDIEKNVVQQSILDFANNYSDVNIKELTETHMSSDNGFEIRTNQLIMEGDFQSLTEVVFEFEKKFKVSSLVSITYLKVKDFNNRKDKLNVQLIFQNYEKSI